MRILGIDPGLASLGWGIVDKTGSKLGHVANGVCKTKGDPLSKRLASLYRQLCQIIETYHPDCAAVEETFVNKDVRGALKLGQARGVALLVPGLFGLEVGEYAPNRIKKTVTGVGHAEKGQIAHMMRVLLPGVKLAGPDAADALAVAICHAHFRPAQSLERVAS